jgi:hypothetical protein
MNRRDFLKSLAAIGSTLALSVDNIDAATQQSVDQVWSNLLVEPQVFYVLDSGLITTSTEGIAIDVSSRAALLNLKLPKTHEDLISLEQQTGYIAGIIESMDVYDDYRWQSWILDQRNLNQALGEVSKWLLCAPNEIDIESAMVSETTGQGEAYLFFEDYPDSCEVLDIDLVETDTMWSRYVAAELRSSVPDANDRAIKLGLPIRFVTWQEL